MSTSTKEKTTKKEQDTKYGKVTKEGMNKMFTQPKGSQTQESTDIQRDDGGLAEANALGGAFTVVDPIPSCVGPIGRFQATRDNFPLHPAVVLFGKRRTGKSYTLRDIMYHCFRDIPFGIVF